MSHVLTILCLGHQARLAAIGTQDGQCKRSELEDLFDCFEPTYIKDALESFPDENLSHLIFNDETSDGHHDPLTEMYRDAGAFLPSLS